MRQGRGRLAWWLESLFLGPLATFLIVVMEPVTPKHPNAA